MSLLEIPVVDAELVFVFRNNKFIKKLKIKKKSKSYFPSTTKSGSKIELDSPFQVK